MIFPKKAAIGIWYLLCYQIRLYLFFSRIWFYSLDRKWKMIFLRKIQENTISSSNVLKRWSFQKRSTRIWSSLDYKEWWYFSFPKIWSYFLDGKWKIIFLKKYMERWYLILIRKYDIVLVWKIKDDLSQEIYGNMIFSVYMYKCYKYDITLLPKKQRLSSPKKMHLKVIDVLDWHSRKSSNDSLYFYGDLLRRFHYYSTLKNKKFDIQDWNLISPSIYLVGDILQ